MKERSSNREIPKGAAIALGVRALVCQRMLEALVTDGDITPDRFITCLRAAVDNSNFTPLIEAAELNQEFVMAVVDFTVPTLEAIAHIKGKGGYG